uniref:RNA polymerase II subunit B1 CTD phosphatase RPAP2 homolog n=1 Tax=Anopheles epiroticus TaxID=199890 RepID=A0A182PAQ4_9DIPT
MVSMFRDRLLASESTLRTTGAQFNGGGNAFCGETFVEETVTSCTTATIIPTESVERDVQHEIIPQTVCRCSDCGKQLEEIQSTYLFQQNCPSNTFSDRALCQGCYQRSKGLETTENVLEKHCKEESLGNAPSLVIDLLPLEASNTSVQNDLRFCCVTHCSQSFADESRLLKHAQEMHAIKLRKNRENQEPGRLFKCHVCFRAFGSSKNLRVHQLVRSNVQIRNFVCKMCGFRCGSSATLTIHERTHTGERPFGCELKEQLQKALRKKKECNDKAQRVVETLIEPGRTEDELLTLLPDINQCHMEDIVQERAIVKLCGYPLCDNELKNIPKQKYVISVSQNKVFDITERKNFCSGECYKASNYIKQQMLTSPLWLRDQEDIPKFRLITGRQLVYRETDVKKPLHTNDVLFKELKIVERKYAPEEQEAILTKEPVLTEHGMDKARQESTVVQDVVGVEETLDDQFFLPSFHAKDFGQQCFTGALVAFFAPSVINQLSIMQASRRRQSPYAIAGKLQL